MEKARFYTKILFLGLFAAFLAFSCKKSSDDDEDDKEYVGGTLTFSLPAYSSPGDTYELVPTGAYTTDGSSIGYCWTSTLNESVRDTTKHIGDPDSFTGAYTLNIPEDFYGSITVTCYAFADGYYTRTQASVTVVIDPESSLSVTGWLPENKKFTDPRDSRAYRYTTIGGRDWFMQNLAYESGKPYYNLEALRDLFGGFYTWDEARTVCPEGWRLPTEEDWMNLAESLTGNTPESYSAFGGISGDLMARAYFNDDQMWPFSPYVTITNSSLFCALPCGYALVKDGTFVFSGFNDYSTYWVDQESGSEKAYYRYLYNNSPDVLVATAYKEYFATNVRCVRDAE